MFTDDEFQRFGRFVILADALANPGRYIQDDVDLVALSIRFPASIKARLEQYAEVSGKSMQFIARELIQHGLNQLDETVIELNEYREQRRAVEASDPDLQDSYRAAYQAQALDAVKSLKGVRS